MDCGSLGSLFEVLDFTTGDRKQTRRCLQFTTVPHCNGTAGGEGEFLSKLYVLRAEVVQSLPVVYEEFTSRVAVVAQGKTR